MEQAAFISTQNPATEAPLMTYPEIDEKHIEKIILKMDLAQQEWSKLSVTERAQLFINLKKCLLKKKDKAALLITQEMGKPITEALGEIEKCALLCEYYANEGPKMLEDETLPSSFYKSYKTYQPLGIILAIMPWNFPFWQVFRFAVPNLLAGNAGLLKHAPITSGCGLMIESLFVEAGFPAYLFKSLIINVTKVPQIIHHPLIQGVTLTGANATGKKVAAEAGSALKKVILELGGNDPYLILKDADLEFAASQCVNARLRNAGQICIAPKRIIIDIKIKSDFEKIILSKAKQFQMDNPLLPHTNFGPMARADLREKVDAQVKALISNGAQCQLGGVIPQHQGYYYPPTVITDVSEDSLAFREEIFGPVICLTTAQDEQDAIRLANKSPYGLGAAVFTQNIDRGIHIAKYCLNAGSCMVNQAVFSDPRLPFGGIKQSGFGRELSVEGLVAFTNVKTVVVNRL